MKSLIKFLLLSFVIVVSSRTPCNPRKFDNDAIVCVCDESHCDDLDPIKKTDKGVITLFETSRNEGYRFKETQLKFGFIHSNDPQNPRHTQTINVDRSKKIQKIIGFGGAFTDSTGINLKRLSPKLQENVIKDYFSPQGIEYTTCRVPIGGSDFSTHAYTLDDTPNDDELIHFNLTKEDLEYKIPFITSAIKASPHSVKIFGSPWSGPAWLKTNNKINNGGFLKGQPGGKEYKIFANYLVKFLEAYKANGIKIWGLTIENEPSAGNNPNYGFNSMGFTPELQRDFLKLDLGPALEKAGFGRNTTDIMIFDDQRDQINHWAEVIFKDPEAAKYVAGTAFHWYFNKPENVVNLDKTYAVDPTKYILNTESSVPPFWKDKVHYVSLGNWERFEHYASDILTDLNHYVAGYVDWNMAVDMEGGPNWGTTFCESPIIVSANGKEYYKQPYYYAIGHFSKFISPDSYKIQVNTNATVEHFDTTAFVRPDGGVVVIALNTSDDPIELNVVDSVDGKLSIVVVSRSIATFIYY